MIINLEDSSFRATITVIYPSGTCTVTHKASGKSYSHTGGGEHTFTVRKKGEWEVVASDGSKRDSGVVNIDEHGDAFKVTLKYELVLFDSTVASGWTKTGHAGHSARITGGKITLTGDTTLDSGALYNIGLFYYADAIACSEGETLKVSVASVGTSYGEFGTEAKAKLIVTTAPDKVDGSTIYDQSSIDDCPHFVAVANISGTGVTSLSLPSGSYYLGIAYTNWVQLSADKVWID